MGRLKASWKSGARRHRVGRAMENAPFVHAHLDFGAALVRIGIWFTPCVAIFSPPLHTLLFLSAYCPLLISLVNRSERSDPHRRRLFEMVQWSVEHVVRLERRSVHTAFEAGSLSQVHRPHGQGDRNALRAGAIVFRFVCDVFGEVVGSCPRYGTE